MTDLISRQAAIEHLKKRLYETALNNETEHPYYEEMADNRVSVWIEELPTIDAVPVVRCKECRWKEQEQPGMVYCPATVGGWVDEDWFCKGGEIDDDWEEPEINPCRGCDDYDGRGGCKSNGGCGAERSEDE